MSNENVNPLNIKLPARKEILTKAIEIATLGDVRITQLSNMLEEDPVITLEFLREANTLDKNSSKLNIFNVHAAVVRLGMGSVLKLLNEIASRPVIEEPEVAAKVETLRIYCQEASFVAQTISSIVYRDLTEISQLAGLFSFVGHMIACVTLKEKYITMTRDMNQTTLSYRLQHNHAFNMTAILTEYFESHKIVPEIIHAFNKEEPCKTARQVNLRYILQSAIELVVAAHSYKWNKYHPNNNLPAKSALRFLKISGEQYFVIYDLVCSYFGELLEKKEDDVDNEEETSQTRLPQESKTSKIEDPSIFFESNVVESSNSVMKILEEELNYILQTNADIENGLKKLSNKGKVLVAEIQSICDQSNNALKLLGDVMSTLVSEGPYARAALIAIGDDRKSAQIKLAFGHNLETGLKILLEDPLSPLGLCLTKMTSFNSNISQDSLSPFGSSSYFISPLQMKEKGPFLLYLDNGEKKSLSFEARKVFRVVLGLLNQKIPNLEA